MGIYLDYNASTPVAPQVVAAMRPFLTEHFGNPSSEHWAGRPARDALETAHGASYRGGYGTVGDGLPGSGSHR